jgi:hypothetical protein
MPPSAISTASASGAAPIMSMRDPHKESPGRGDQT